MRSPEFLSCSSNDRSADASCCPLSTSYGGNCASFQEPRRGNQECREVERRSSTSKEIVTVEQSAVSIEWGQSRSCYDLCVRFSNSLSGFGGSQTAGERLNFGSPGARGGMWLHLFRYKRSQRCLIASKMVDQSTHDVSLRRQPLALCPSHATAIKR